MNRRQMLATLPFFVINNEFRVKHHYQGPAEENPLDRTWVDRIIEKYRDSQEFIPFYGNKNWAIYRERCTRCYLPPSEPIWFTCETWQENYLWAGRVTVVKDTCFWEKDKRTTNYYLCRNPHSFVVRKATTSDMPAFAIKRPF